MLNVNNDTRKLNLTYLTLYSSVSIVGFKQILNICKKNAMKLKFMKNYAYQTVNDFRDNPVSFERSSAD